MMDLTVLTLLPSTSIDAPIEARLASVALDALPDFTRLDDEDVQDDKLRDGSLLLNGSQSTTPYITETALRRLRLPEHPRYILSERFQNDLQRPWFQFELKKAPVDHAFWRHAWNCDDLDEDFDVMDLFLIMPNRYSDTAKFFGVIDARPESEEIRLLVLPPAVKQVSNLLSCEFRNVRLNDPLRPSYQTFYVAGAAAPRNGHDPVYKYDIAINGHLSVSSDGTRTGLQLLQHESDERLVWYEELCINCRDIVDSEHFHNLKSAIIRGATSGAILMFDRVSAFTTSMNSNRKFVHPEVNRKTRDIRLLQFLGSPGDKSIKLKLVVRNLDDFPVFKALSYVWGDDTGHAMHYTQYQPEDDMSKWPMIKNHTSKTVFLESFEKITESIIVNKAPLMTTKHLANALRYLRDRGECKYFWVDALCIDQSSWEDRSSQVCMMAEIYAQAQEVIAWLGLGNKADSTVELLSMFGQETFDLAQFVQWAEVKGSEEEEKENLLTRMEASEGRDTKDKPWKVAVLGLPNADLGDAAEDIIYRTLYACLRDRAFINSVEDIVNHPWWHRLWIYQESVIPSSLVLHRGSYSVEFETLWRAYSAIIRLSDLTPFYEHFPKPMLSPLSLDSSKYRMLASIRLERQRRHHTGSNFTATIPNDWLFYIQQLAERGASDPRDVIYAAMGLATFPPKNIVPDYSKAISEVYTNAAKETIKDSDDLTILSICGGVMQSSATWASYLLHKDVELRRKAAPLPSWVPYWGQQHRLGMGAKLLQSPDRSATAFCAGGTGGAGAKFSKDSRILFAMGMVVDIVGRVVKGYAGKPQGGGTQVTYDGKDFVHSKVPYKSTLRCAEWFQAYDDWQIAITSLSSSKHTSTYVTGESITSAFQHALYAPDFGLNLCYGGLLFHGDEDYHDKRIDEFRVRFSAEEKSLKQDKITMPTLQLQAELDEELTALVGSMTISTKHELLITEKGYIGVSPPGCSQVGGVQVGDLVVVLRGAAVPLILRKVGDLERFLLIGDAYVHGIMYGSVLEGHTASDLRKFPIM
ncbi:hypothetical protein VTL71DRAFT_14146 [Oculimacula yallundae]|uniref:Heterokaryon incompatibility domain-containing protein n=1 Tax=Oculimacula yallundae TaxID=86028 RepID=A0ABR4CJ00_9HELO